MKTIGALFSSVAAVDRAIARLHAAGYEQEVLGVLAREDVLKETGESRGEEGEVSEEISQGASGGAIVGGVAGLIAGIAALAVPGFGLVVTAGTAAAALGSTAVGAGIGAATGGAIGALIELGIAEGHAEAYAEGIKRGGILLAVNVTEDRLDEVRQILSESGAVDIESTQKNWQAQGWSEFDPSMDPGEQYPTLL